MRNDPEMQARLAANYSRLADLKRDMPLLEEENAVRHAQLDDLKAGIIDHERNIGMNLEFKDLALMAAAGTIFIVIIANILGAFYGMIGVAVTGLCVSAMPITGILRLDRAAQGHLSQHVMIIFIMLAMPCVLIFLAISPLHLSVLSINGLKLLLEIGAPAGILGGVIAVITGTIRTRTHFRRMRSGEASVPEQAWEKLSERREELV
jgi:hypothetical protein